MIQSEYKIPRTSESHLETITHWAKGAGFSDHRIALQNGVVFIKPALSDAYRFTLTVKRNYLLLGRFA
jgi:hypothetical protein